MGDQFAVVHLEARPTISAVLERHLTRTQVVYEGGVRTESVWVPDNADINRVALNRDLISRTDNGKERHLTIDQAVRRRIEESKAKVKDDSVQAIEVILSGSHETLAALSEQQLADWTAESLAWAKKEWGEQNVVAAVLHRDERTPHLHLVIVPLVQGLSRRTKAKREQMAREGKTFKQYNIDSDRWRLCKNEVFTKPRLAHYHTDYAKVVGEKYGLQRGVRAEAGSRKNHQSSIDYNRQLQRFRDELNAEYEELNQKMEDVEVKIFDNNMEQQFQMHEHQLLRDECEAAEEKKASLENDIVQTKNELSGIERDIHLATQELSAKTDSLKALSSVGLLRMINAIPAMIMRDIQQIVTRYGWFGEIDNMALSGNTLKLSMTSDADGFVDYVLNVDYTTGMVRRNNSVQEEGRRMTELVDYFSTKLTPEAKRLVIGMYRRDAKELSADKLEEIAPKKQSKSQPRRHF